MTDEDNTQEISRFYRKLLKTKPSWPYYFSGLVKVDNIDKVVNMKNVKYAIKYGEFERQVATSIAEMVFSRWSLIDNTEKMGILNYLISQHETLLSRLINVSAKFAKIFEFCDFIYEEKQVEYAACKQNYWQPLEY
ncbi:MAG: hypothetical protein AB8B80_07745 [Marinicellaceae bacterium]